jgi:hypothetical protein
MSTNPIPIPIPPGHATFSDLPRNVRVKLYSYLLISPNPVFYIQGCPRPCSNLTHRHSGNRFTEDELDIAGTDALVRRPRTYPNRPFKPPQAVYEASQILYSKNHFLVHGPGLLSFLNLDIISQDDEVFSTSRKWLQRITVICSTSSKKKVTHPDYWTPIPTLRALLYCPNLHNVTIKVAGREGDIFEALAMFLHIANVCAELRSRLADGFEVTMSHLHREGGETCAVADITWLFDSCSSAETETVKGTTGWKQILSTHLATTTVLRSDYRKCRTNESEVKSARRLLPGSPGGAHHGGATHSSGLTDLMLGTHICMGITYKSKYYRISHITYHLLNRISVKFQPSPPSFLHITLYVAVAPPKLPLFYLVIAAPATPLLPRCRQLASPLWLGPYI